MAVHIAWRLSSIASVDIPAEFVYGESHDIVLNYYRPTDDFAFHKIFNMLACILMFKVVGVLVL